MIPAKPSCRIVIIEDNPADVFLVEHALQQQGLRFELITLEDGPEALEYLGDAASPLPSVIVVDLNLPKADGEQLLRQIRQLPALADVPILVWTSSQSPRDQAMVERFGVARFLTKPASLDEALKIGQIICELLNRAGNEQARMTAKR